MRALASHVQRLVVPRETERCPNCGKVVYRGDCRHSSTIKTSWGASTLYGVCRECARAHDNDKHDGRL